MLITAIRLNQNQSNIVGTVGRYLAGHYSYCLLTMQWGISSLPLIEWDRFSPISEIWVIFVIYVRKIRRPWQNENHGKTPKIMVFTGRLPITYLHGICSETITALWHCDLRMALLHIGLVKHKEISFKVYTVYILLFILLLILSTVTIWWIGWSHDMYCDCECCVVLTRLIPSDRFRIHWPWSLNLLF